MRLAWAALVACGGTAPVAKHEPVITQSAISPSAPTCAEIAVILPMPRSLVDQRAIAAKEKAIAKACMDDRWSSSVIACVASSTNPVDCLGGLTVAQHKAYDDAIASWLYTFANEADVADADPVSCLDVQHVELFDPPITGATPERDWELRARKNLVFALCIAHSWPEDTIRCLRDASTESETATCVASLDPQLHPRLVAVRDLATAIEKRRKAPKKLECKLVAEHHITEARWKAALKAKKPTERKTAIAEARKAMADACTSEGWDEATRTCLLADGGEETCLDKIRWTPSAVALVSTVPMISLPECGDYEAAVRELEQCASAPPETRTAMRQGFQALEQATGDIPFDQKETIVKTCRQAADTIRQVRAAYGC
jgi:hypothetical protein